MLVRLEYRKTGKARWISHLDTMRTFQRAFIRAGIPLAHSEGFNPHPKLNIILPLPTGAESLRELLDAELLEEAPGLVERLNGALPEGIVMTAVGQPVMKAGDVRFAAWTILLDAGDKTPQNTAEMAASALTAKEIMILKKTKRGESEIDLAPHLHELSVTTRPGGAAVSVILPCFEPALAPKHIADALKIRAEELKSVRTELFNEKMERYC